MTNNQLKQIRQVIMGSLLAMAGSVAVAATTWNFSTCNATAGNQTGSSYGNSWNCAGDTGTNKVTVTAWGGANATGSTGFQTAYVSNQGGSGFGIASQYETTAVSQPNHAADNSPTNSTPDMFLLRFDQAVALNTVTLGWNQSDADFTLMAYSGPVTTASTLIGGKIASNSGGTGLTTGGLGSGWSLIEQVGDAAPDAVTAASSTDIIRTVNGTPTTGVTSSWWLISAYSAGYNGSTAIDTNLDYFKLFSVANKDLPTNKTPEPSSLALMGVALAGFMAVRRRGKLGN